MGIETNRVDGGGETREPKREEAREIERELLIVQ